MTQLWQQGCKGQRPPTEQRGVESADWCYCTCNVWMFPRSKNVLLKNQNIGESATCSHTDYSLVPVLSPAKQLQESWERLPSVWMKSENNEHVKLCQRSGNLQSLQFTSSEVLRCHTRILTSVIDSVLLCTLTLKVCPKRQAPRADSIRLSMGSRG